VNYNMIRRKRRTPIKRRVATHLVFLLMLPFVFVASVGQILVEIGGVVKCLATQPMNLVYVKWDMDLP